MIEVNRINLSELIELHTLCDKDFIPPLSDRVDIRSYCEKLVRNAELITCSSASGVEGVLAIYCNDQVNKIAFISSVCVHPRARGRKIGSAMLDHAIRYAGQMGMTTVRLETGSANAPAIRLYRSRGFIITADKDDVAVMETEIRHALAMIDREAIVPLVSVIMVTYNHRPYISQAIEGVLAQKTSFPFELLVADDASADGNQEIIEGYALRFPDMIVPILRQKNIGANANWFDAFERTRGRYIAICEGDDYWTDPGKLQKQADILENNSGFGMVCTDYSRYFQATGTFRHNCFDTHKYRDEVRFNDYILDMSSIGTATVLIRKDIVRRFMKEIPRDTMAGFVGSDTPLWLFTASVSRIAVMPGETAVYRFLEKSACHFPDPDDHYRFVLKGFKMADYFYEHYGNSDPRLLDGLNRKKLRAALFHGYRTLNRKQAKDAFIQLSSYDMSFRQKISARVMLAGSRNTYLRRIAASVMRLKQP